jgi:hypothetical protein
VGRRRITLFPRDTRAREAFLSRAKLIELLLREALSRRRKDRTREQP